jgi:chromosomal replication initiator protein
MASAKQPVAEVVEVPVNRAEMRRLREIEAAERYRQERLRRRAEHAELILSINAELSRANAAIGKRKGHKVPFGKIVKRICRATRVSEHEIMQNRRNVDIVFARQAIMYWTARLTTMSLPEIGRRLGRDHTTILHGRHKYVEKRAKGELKHPPRFLKPAR